MGPERRPPITTPLGCFLSSTAGSVFFILAITIGALVGSMVGGEQGTVVGFVGLGFLSVFTPWRRWLVRWWQEWERSRRSDGPRS
ncbi:MAG: hypothetical protein HY689_14080 [Chloroflexi bacterium]|nr:hypothetical protein [Chloroflexota bacterium]